MEHIFSVMGFHQYYILVQSDGMIVGTDAR